jgi:twitching motility protein PilI
LTNSSGEHPFELLCKLEARALRSPRILPCPEETSTSWRGVGLRLGETRLVVKNQQVREVAPIPELTRVPDCKPWFLGMVNLHGATLAVIHLRRFLSGSPGEPRPLTHMLVVERGGVRVGLAVDQVLGLRQLRAADHIGAVAITPVWLQPYVQGWYVVEDGEWGEMDIDAILCLPELLNARSDGAHPAGATRHAENRARAL